MVANEKGKPEKRYLFDNPRNVKAVIFALLAVCAGLFVADNYVERYYDHPWETLFGFYAIYGFIACVVLVLAAKELRKLIMRKENYYDD